ncbi:hypothetical protein ACSTIX_10520 [Vibrio parahaemolyticus]
MLETVIGWLSIWALAGYFAAPWFPVARSKKAAYVQIFIIGPLAWIGVPAICAFTGKKH